MPRLRHALRVPDARRPVAVVPGVQGRRSAEKAVGVLRAVENARQIVFRSSDAGLRSLRRSSRAWSLLPQLSVAAPFGREPDGGGRAVEVFLHPLDIVN